MSRYVLECPDCGAQGELKRYAPESWSRCAACGAMMIVPRAPGDAAPAPRVPWRTSLVALLLCAAAALGALLLARERRAREEAAARVVEEPFTAGVLARELHAWAWPLGRGFAWEYALSGGGSEVREVLRAWEGPGGAPEFELGLRGPEPGSLRFRVTREGLRLLAANGRELAEPPLFLPHPLEADSAWTLRSPADGWDLACRATAVEKLRVPAGEFGGCVRVELSGTRGKRDVRETLWFARGVGLVKRESPAGVAELRKVNVYAALKR